MQSPYYNTIYVSYHLALDLKISTYQNSLSFHKSRATFFTSWTLFRLYFILLHLYHLIISQPPMPVHCVYLSIRLTVNTAFFCILLYFVSFYLFIYFFFHHFSQPFLFRSLPCGIPADIEVSERPGYLHISSSLFHICISVPFLSIPLFCLISVALSLGN